jgi:hypothetical protein
MLLRSRSSASVLIVLRQRTLSTAAAAAATNSNPAVVEFAHSAHTVGKETALNLVKKPWGENSIRTGLIGIKCGMTRGWDAFGKHMPLTVVKA